MKYPFLLHAEFDLTRRQGQTWFCKAIVEQTELSELRNVLANVRSPKFGTLEFRLRVLRHWLALWSVELHSCYLTGDVIRGLDLRFLQEIGVQLSFEVNNKFFSGRFK